MFSTPTNYGVLLFLYSYVALLEEEGRAFSPSYFGSVTTIFFFLYLYIYSVEEEFFGSGSGSSVRRLQCPGLYRHHHPDVSRRNEAGDPSLSVASVGISNVPPQYAHTSLSPSCLRGASQFEQLRVLNFIMLRLLSADRSEQSLIQVLHLKLLHHSRIRSSDYRCCHQLRIYIVNSCM